MPVTSTWIEQPHIPGFIFSPRVTDDDIEAWGKLGLALAQQERIYPLVDFSSTQVLPRNLINTALRSRALLAFISHKNIGFFVFVTPDEQLRSMIDTVFRNIPYIITHTRDSALRYLQEQIPPDTE